MAYGVDNSLRLEDFRKDFRVNVISLTDDDIEFDMIGIDAAVANAFRRILLAEVCDSTTTIHCSVCGGKRLSDWSCFHHDIGYFAQLCLILVCLLSLCYVFVSCVKPLAREFPSQATFENLFLR